MPDVFICHASTDQWRADRVCDALELEGITCWIAPRDVPRQYPHAWGQGALLNEVLAQTRILLLLLSQDSATSPRIAREIKAAIRLKRACLSVGFDSSVAEWSERLPWDRHRTRHVDVSSFGSGGGYEQLTDAVREALGAAGPAGTDPDRGPRFAFVSYKREDLPRVETHLRTLARIECPVWYDSGIPGGAEWDAMIEARIRSCGFVLVFLSAAAVASKLVRREVKFADKLDKPIVPVLLEPVELDGGLDMLLSQYQIIDSRDRDFEARLEAAIRTVLSSAVGGSAGLPPREGPMEAASVPTGRAPASRVSGPPWSTECLGDSETRLLQYIRGKPDVHWTLDVLSHLLTARPEVAGTGPALVQSVHSLAEKGFFRIDSAGGLTLTPKAVGFFRKPVLAERNIAGEPAADPVESLTDLGFDPTIDLTDLLREPGDGGDAPAIEPPLASEADIEFIERHLAEGRVFMKYNLVEQAREQFSAIVSRFPGNEAAEEELRRLDGERHPARETAVSQQALAVLVSRQSGIVYSMVKPEVLIGRFDSATGTTPDIDLTAEDPSGNISRRHARLVRKDDGRFFVAEEIGTMNVTLLNGKKPPNGVLVPITDGDELVLGRVALIFRPLPVEPSSGEPGE